MRKVLVIVAVTALGLLVFRGVIYRAVVSYKIVEA